MIDNEAERIRWLKAFANANKEQQNKKKTSTQEECIAFMLKGRKVRDHKRSRLEELHAYRAQRCIDAANNRAIQLREAQKADEEKQRRASEEQRERKADVERRREIEREAREAMPTVFWNEHYTCMNDKVVVDPDVVLERCKSGRLFES